jgi:YfiH family protein
MFDVVRHGSPVVALVVTATERADGDVHPHRVDAVTLGARQRALTGAPWTMLDQVHGIDVVTYDTDIDDEIDDEMDDDGWAPTLGVGDVLVAVRPARPVAVWSADCAPVVLADESGTTIVVAHAGWRGLAAGIVDVAVDALEADGGRVGAAVVGPCIGACCYEFGAPELDAVADGVGAPPASLRARTADGRPSLDVRAAVTAAFTRRGITGPALTVVDGCTACDPRWYSHRGGDRERQATVAWFDDGLRA